MGTKNPFSCAYLKCKLYFKWNWEVFSLHWIFIFVVANPSIFCNTLAIGSGPLTTILAYLFLAQRNPKLQDLSGLGCSGPLFVFAVNWLGSRLWWAEVVHKLCKESTGKLLLHSAQSPRINIYYSCSEWRSWFMPGCLLSLQWLKNSKPCRHWQAQCL